jgi:hypothetical protein
MTDAMNAPQIPTPEAGDTPGDETPSFSPSASESASKGRERTVACGGDTLTPGDEIPSQGLAFARRARAVTADVTQGPEGGAEPLDSEAAGDQPQASADLPAFLRQHLPGYVPSVLRQAGVVVTPPVTRASGAHLEPVGQHKLEDDDEIPEFLRQHGVTSLARHAQPIARDREPSEGSQADQPSRFVPRIQREAGLVTFPITPSQAPPASVTPTVTAAPVAGSVCPTCNCRVVPARLSAAERQRAYRRRKREQGQGVAKGD